MHFLNDYLTYIQKMESDKLTAENLLTVLSSNEAHIRLFGQITIPYAAVLFIE